MLFLRAHRLLYVIGAGLILAGLGALAVAVNGDVQERIEESRSGCDAAIGACDGSSVRNVALAAALLLLLAGLGVIWGGMHLGRAMAGLQERLSTAVADRSAAATASLDDVFERLTGVGLHLDPDAFQDATVVTTSHTIDLSGADGDDDELLERGTPATATVDGFQPLVTVGERVAAVLRLTVTPPAGTAYEATIDAAVPRSVADRLRRGMRVPVRIDPDRPERVLVEWERA